MDSQLWQGSLGGNFSDCPNGSQWVWDVFSECAQDIRDFASIVLGLVSIFCFAAASFPQYYQACKTGNMDQALSIYFLLGWLGGDSLNLIGSFLANQLPLQVYTAIYYVLADLVMLSLYLYYKVKNQSRGFSAPINAAFAFVFLGTVSATSLLGRAGSTVETVTFKGRTLLSATVDVAGCEPFTKKEIIGFTVGSIASLLYLFSRVPQIYTNVSDPLEVGMGSNPLLGLSFLGEGERSSLSAEIPELGVGEFPLSLRAADARGRGLQANNQLCFQNLPKGHLSVFSHWILIDLTS
ncbi:lysosomal amino acid transporter 1 homolog isoform X2 [Eretmochelys imbricata]